MPNINLLFLQDVILRRITFFQPILPPIAAPVMRPDSLLRLWRYMNLLRTHLLTSTDASAGCYIGLADTGFGVIHNSGTVSSTKLNGFFSVAQRLGSQTFDQAVAGSIPSRGVIKSLSHLGQLSHPSLRSR